jgi:hypothetical protein
VWLSLDEVTPAQAKALPISPGMVKYGPAVSSMDLAWFDRSPGADVDGPLAEREIGGLRFRLVAKPGKFTPLPGGSGVETIRMSTWLSPSPANPRQALGLQSTPARQSLLFLPVFAQLPGTGHRNARLIN